MGMREVENAILAELKTVANNPRLKIKDMAEWQTGDGMKAQDGETKFYLPVLMISVAVPNTALAAPVKKAKTP